jgi:tetraacyldisaccharide-1-P 4'-kinase
MNYIDELFPNGRMRRAMFRLVKKYIVTTAQYVAKYMYNMIKTNQQLHDNISSMPVAPMSSYMASFMSKS